MSLLWFSMLCAALKKNLCCHQELIHVVSVSPSPREIIQADMEIWESSGQWGFSCYSHFKTCLSGLYQIHLITRFLLLFVVAALVVNDESIIPITKTVDLNMFVISCLQASLITLQKRSGWSIAPQELQEICRAM